MLKTKWWLWFRIGAISVVFILSLIGRLGNLRSLLVIGPAFGVFLYLVLFLSKWRERFRQKRAAPSRGEENDLGESFLCVLDWLVAIGFLLKLFRSVTWLRMAQQVQLFP